MIRIISGKYKGRRLIEKKNTLVRPTQAKIRKSIFQILEPFNDKTVLDLYSGFGTLGIEAISRGAKFVKFVEKDKTVIKILKKNINLLNIEKMEIINSDVKKFLMWEKKRYDLIIADPPYDSNDYKFLNEIVNPLLKSDGIFCLEMKKRNIEGNYFRLNIYGSSQVVFWRHAS